MTGRLVSINLSNGGVPKRPVPECRVTESGLEGDRQRDLHFHGGPNRAVCLYPLERIR
jgi:MOSC domain-containing protein YiiM